MWNKRNSCRNNVIGDNMKIETIFELNEKQLLIEKEKLLKTLRKEKIKLVKMECENKHKERKLYLETDFANLKLTNDKLRNSFVQNKLEKSEYEIKIHKIFLKEIEDNIKLIDDILLFKNNK